MIYLADTTSVMAVTPFPRLNNGVAGRVRRPTGWEHGTASGRRKQLCYTGDKVVDFHMPARQAGRLCRRARHGCHP